MSEWLPEIRRRLSAAGLDPAREAEIAQELDQHLSDRYAEMRAAGADDEDARHAALGELDEDARMRRELRGIERAESRLPPPGTPNRGSLLAGLWQDLRYAVRMLRRNPGFTALAVVTLALGVFATTTVYAIVDNVLFRPVPYADIDRLVRVFEIRTDDPSKSVSASYPNYEDWKARSRTIEAFGIYRSRSLILTEPEPERVTAGTVTPGYFEAAGARPARGRVFSEADGAPGAPAVMVISHGAWERRFGSDPNVVGRTVATVDGPMEIIGVLQPTPMFAGTLDLWMPFQRTTNAAMRGVRGMWVMGRLREGVTLEQASAEMTTIAAALAAEYPDTNAGWSVRLLSMQEWTVGGMRTTLYTFLGAVGCILLIACANVAGLLVARGAARSREIAVRRALGAGRGRIVRQLLTESVLLAVVGGSVGALLAWWTIASLVPLFPLSLPADRIGVDGRVLAVAITASGLTGLLFGIVPALGLSRAGSASSLKDQGRSTPRWGRRLGGTLIVAEVALSLILLAGAGLMVRTLLQLYAVDPGIQPEQLAALRVTPLLPAKAEPARAWTFYSAVLERVKALPGVESAALIDTAPFGGSVAFSMAVADENPARVGVSPRAVSPDYFRTMGIPLKAGRDFSATDASTSRPVVIINATAAAKLWGAQTPLGRHLRFATSRETFGEPWEVVGVVGDVRHDSLDGEVYAEIYQPAAQKPPAAMTVVARSPAPEALAAPFRAQMTGLPERPLLGTATTFTAMRERTTLSRRNQAVLLGVLGALGTILAAVGVFGLTAFSVGQRTKEIGIRMALGADNVRVLGTVVGSQLVPIALGVAFGIGGSWWATRALSSFLFGVKPTDPATFASVAAIITIVGLAACYLPARRALRVDPVNALRAE